MPRKGDWIPLEIRFWAKVDKRGPDECWEFRGYLNNGYASISEGGRGGRVLKAHRVGYELQVGPIPEGLTLDHLCKNRACVNARHLEPVTLEENILRGSSPAANCARQTHCKRGHAFVEGNLMGDKGRRRCRTCEQQRWLRRWQEKKLALSHGGGE